MPNVEPTAAVLSAYYRNDAVRARMLEFLGGRSLNDATAMYVVGNDGSSESHLCEAQPVTRLFQLMEEGLDLERSLWDRKSLVIDLDIDYENFDSPAEAYLNPERIFKILHPVVDIALDVLNECGIRPLHMVSGKGHHLVWSIGRAAPAFKRLAKLGEIPDSLASFGEGGCHGLGDRVSSTLARAFAGAGMLLEYVAHRVLRRSRSRCSVPVQVTAVEVGPGPKGREIVSLDISEYGEPLYARRIRMPFSAYLKPRRLIWCLGEDWVQSTPPIIEVPLIGIPVRKAIDVMRSPEAVLDLASRVSTAIPDQSEQCLDLLDAYEQSDLAAFHQSFLADQEQHPAPERKVLKLTEFDESVLPPCTRCILDNPNDWLLKPVGVQHVTRVLLAVGWKTRDIVALIHERFEADFGWGNIWDHRDPTYRAQFYVRLFAGLIELGVDQLTDLNCISHQEKGYCPGEWCSYNLADYQVALRRRNRE